MPTRELSISPLTRMCQATVLGNEQHFSFPLSSEFIFMLLLLSPGDKLTTFLPFSWQWERGYKNGETGSSLWWLKAVFKSTYITLYLNRCWCILTGKRWRVDSKVGQCELWCLGIIECLYLRTACGPQTQCSFLRKGWHSRVKEVRRRYNWMPTFVSSLKHFPSRACF